MSRLVLFHVLAGALKRRMVVFLSGVVVFVDASLLSVPTFL